VNDGATAVAFPTIGALPRTGVTAKESREGDRPVLQVVSRTGARPLDLPALGEAFRSEAPILLAAARAIVLDEAEAEDLVQTTFEIAVRRLSQLRDPLALRSWLLAIQTREAFRVRRRLRGVLRLDVRAGDTLPAPGSAADDVALREALRKLPPRLRAALVLHHMVGLSVAEAAAIMGTSPNTVKAQLRTGLARLRRELDDD